MARLAFAVLLGSALAGVLALITNSTLSALLCAGLGLASLEVFVLARLAGGFSPVLIPVIAVNAIFLAAPLVWDKVQQQATVSMRVYASDDLLSRAAVVATAFCAAYTVGAAIVRPKKIAITFSRLRQSGALRIPNGALVLAAILAVLLAVYAWQGAILQGTYLESRGPDWAVSASSALGLPFAVLAFALVAMRPGPWRGLAFVGLGVVVLILFGRSTRTLALVPGLVLVARATVSRQNMKFQTVFLACMATALFLQLALIGRGSPAGVGIIPLGGQLLSHPGEVFSGFGLAASAGNFLVSAPLTALVAARPISSSVFWTSVNPLPSYFTDWNEVRGTLTFNAITPYNALGELAAQGWVTLTVCGFIIGLFFSASTRVAAQLDGKFQVIASLVVLAAIAYFSVIVMQYNLRSASRLVWYTVGGVTGIWIASLLAQRDPPSDLSR